MTYFFMTYYYMQLYLIIYPILLGNGHITDKTGHIGPRITFYVSYLIFSS